nr:hypothetical protein [Spiroplasma clarkii]
MSYKIKNVNALVQRRDYTKVSGDLELPNLIELQTDTFDWFVKKGINEVFEEVFPVVSADGDIVLTMSDWAFREPRMSIPKAKEESKIYDAPIYANLSLTIHQEDVEIFKEEISGNMETFLKDDYKKRLNQQGWNLKIAKTSYTFLNSSQNQVKKIQSKLK